MSCRSCDAPIVWIKSPAGKSIPCDPPVLSVVTDAGEVVRGRISHFATCPNAAQHRKPRELPAPPPVAGLFPGDLS